MIGRICCSGLLVAALAVPPVLAQETVNAVSLAQGGVLLSYSSEYGHNASPQWIALALIDGDPATGWASANGATAPHEFVFELAQTFMVSKLAFDTVATEEGSHPGISASSLEVSVGNGDASGPFTTVFSGAIAPSSIIEIELSEPIQARWIVLTIDANGGRDDYTELMEFSAFGEPAGAHRAAQSIAGVYDTNWGPFFVTVDGDQIRGCYDHDQGEFSGSSTGGFLSIAWRETGDQDGHAVLAITEDGSRFAGFWYENGTRQGTWLGTANDTASRPACAEELIAPIKSAVEEALDETGVAVLYGIYFDLDSAEIQSRSEPMLTQLSTWLKDNPDAAVVLGGHTDSSGEDDYNLQLSADRADAVVAWLVDAGIDAVRLSATGHGETQPVADNETPAGRSLNRRVEVTVQ